MYGEHPLKDAIWIARACATNQIARFAPGFYLRITKQTGRGDREGERPKEIAAYFRRCFDEYFGVLGAKPDTYLPGKVLLEYGPGDFPGVAILMIAYGAQKVFCVDRFPMLAISQKNLAALEELLADLPRAKAVRARAALTDRSLLEYVVKPSGLSGLRGDIDFVYSRAVLEHVDDLPATFADMAAAMRPGAETAHLVDLKSHGLHRSNPLDFLSWPQLVWQGMFSHKGFPNRCRINVYREALRANGLVTKMLRPTAKARPADVAQVRPHLAAPFRNIADEDLEWLGFWLVCRKQAC